MSKANSNSAENFFAGVVNTVSDLTATLTSETQKFLEQTTTST